MKRIFIIIMLCLSLLGCALFKKTSKTSSMVSQSSTNQLDASQLVLKNADKETQVFTYWNDTGFYQYQHIKERVEQAKTGKISIKEKAVLSQENRVKRTEPAVTWIYIGMVVLFAVIFFLFRRWKYTTLI